MKKLHNIMVIILLVIFICHLNSCASGNYMTQIQPQPTEPPNNIEPPDSANGIPEGYSFPAEWEKHKATWLAWPHKENGERYRDSIEHVWIEMTRELRSGEEVHILVQDQEREERTKSILTHNNVSLENVFFHQIPTDDVWMRDMGPCFVSDGKGNLAIVDWQFNGWGDRYEYEIDQHVDTEIAKLLDIPVYKVNMILEGGAIDVNGAGSLLTTESVALNTNRNPDLTKEQASDLLKKYYGQQHIIWVPGIPYEISGDTTDGHIDGWAKFISKDKIITGLWWEDPKVDSEIKKNIELLRNEKDQDGKALNVTLSNNMDTNFYIGNEVILYPWTEGHDDWYKKMEKALEALFPDKKIVGIDCTRLYVHGGAIHCVTQQQPLL